MHGKHWSNEREGKLGLHCREARRRIWSGCLDDVRFSLVPHTCDNNSVINSQSPDDSGKDVHDVRDQNGNVSDKYEMLSLLWKPSYQKPIAQ